ncbi:MAG: sigma-70 family RNA polymerase sigma factor [Bacteroidales bacterium]|nr:sigma-70 family RNA polymerase sigma factor [Bacteroidales bacterium]
MNRREEEILTLYAELLRDFQSHLLSYCYRHSRDEADADQLLVGITNAMLRGVRTLRPDSSPSERNRWLRRLMRQTLADHRRRQPSFVSIDHAIDIAVESDADAELVESLLQHLNPDERALLQDRLAGFTPSELSGRYNVSVDAIYQRYHRIIKKLKTIYKQYYE